MGLFKKYKASVDNLQTENAFDPMNIAILFILRIRKDSLK